MSDDRLDEIRARNYLRAASYATKETQQDKDISCLLDRLAADSAEIEQLREALKFYRDAWHGHPGGQVAGGGWPQDPVWDPDEILIEDGGRKARAALEDKP